MENEKRYVVRAMRNFKFTWSGQVKDYLKKTMDDASNLAGMTVKSIIEEHERKSGPSPHSKLKRARQVMEVVSEDKRYGRSDMDISTLGSTPSKIRNQVDPSIRVAGEQQPSPNVPTIREY